MLSNTWMTQKATLSCRMLINPPETVSEAEARSYPGEFAERSDAGPLTRWPVYTIQEPAPNPQSRITLSTERDALGMQRIQLDWRLSPLDLATSQSAARALAEEIGRLNAGRFRLEPWLRRNTASWTGLVGQNHHMGTTRMSDHPSTGVVDRNGRVHGLANLFVAGSSVFPTCGSDNPTFTIVALALRLSDHLRSRRP
jgi:choline dehydrogenase-like flavoprotein